ncbi:SdrD B-like domain-containing protein, partial [Staphylococcus coagulans]
MKASHQGGLSPNKQNKYSIRKYTVGTASLLIGTTLIFGVHAKDASAAEEVAKQTQLAEEKTEDTAEATGESDSDLIPEVPTQDTNQDNAIEDLPEEGATSEKTVNNAEQTQEDETVVEKKQGEDKASSKTQPTATEKSNENEKAATVDENKEQQATVAERKAVMSQPQETEKSNATNTTPTTTESTPQPKQLAETMKQVTALEDSQEKEAKLVDYYSKNAGVNSETAKQVVQGMNLDYQNLDSDRLTAEMLIALANKQEQNTPKATPVSLKPRSAMMRSASFADVQPTALSGKNVNNLITVTQANIEEDGKKDGKIDAHDAEAVNFTALFKIDDAVKKGDTFTVKYGNNIAPTDYDLVAFRPVDIKDKSGKVIAEGKYDKASKTTTYTFTDYVDTFEKVTAYLDMFAYIDRGVVQNDSYNLPITFTLANQSTSVNKNVIYSTSEVYDTASLNAFFNDVEKSTNTVEQIIYVNTKKNAGNTTASLFIYGYGVGNPNKPGANYIDPSTKIEIYNAKSGQNLPNSMKILDYSNFDNVTKNKYISYGRDYAQISLGNIGTDVYVVRVVSKIDPASKDDVYQSAKLTTIGRTQGAQVLKYNFAKWTADASGGDSQLIPPPAKTYKIGDYVWEDVDNDGIQGTHKDEKPLKNVLVTLKYADGSSKSVRTDEKGYYEFDGLTDKETYTISFETPEDYAPVKKEQGQDRGKDSNGTDVIIKIDGKDNMTIDSGFYKPVYKLGDKVWNDLNKDGVQGDNEPGISGVKVTLKDKAGQKLKETQTNKDGKYEFTDLANGEYQVDFETPEGYVPTIENTQDDTKDSDGPSNAKGVIKYKDNLTVDQGFYKKEEPKYHVGDKVWEDTNKDGIQQDGESGISDVKVTLKGKDGQTIETKTTDDQGKYLFENVAKGEYTIEFETPQGYTPTVTGKGELDKDSNGTSAEITVTQNDLTIDSGFYKPTYSLGDRVWEDTNKNGIQDEDEKGIKGVKVTLKDSTGEELDTTVTNDKGEYEFKDLPNGEYQVDFETPEGYLPTVANTEDDTKDSDGPLNAKGVIKDEDNLTVDQGFYKKEEPPVQKPATYKVGDKVWHDTNKDGIQNVNEPGISGVTVTLKQPDGTLITTKTDKEGNYIFKD